jgi:hypothetical protein
MRRPSRQSSMLSQMDLEALISRLQDHALADAPGTMSDAEVDAALALLDRALPDLHDIELRAAAGQPIPVTVASTANADDCPITKRATK